MKTLPFFVILLLSSAISLTVSAQAIIQGSGKSLVFDGTNQVIIPDAPSFDHPAKNISIEAWIYPTSYAGSVIFSKHETAGTREYTMSLVPDGRIRFDVFDNTPVNYLTYSNSQVHLNEWTHVAGTYSYTAGISSIYINGILDKTNFIGQINVDATAIKPMIGAYWAPGSITRGQFIGSIDEVRLWHSVRSQIDIRENMCKTLTSPQTNLIAYYRLDESNGIMSNDASGNGNNGVLNNFHPIQITNRNFSGAPIGNASTYVYTNNWPGVTLNLNSFSGNFNVKNINNSADGFHLYRADTIPNSLLGISGFTNDIYYGTFIVNGPTATYDVSHTYSTITNCQNDPLLSERDNNADLTWNDMAASDNRTLERLTKTNISLRREFILSFNKDTIGFEKDTFFCQGSNLILDPGPSFVNYLWQDGSTNQTYTISTPGKYWVTLTESGCNVKTDTFTIKLLSPPDVSLGKDTSICINSTLQITLNKEKNTSYKWQDNSINDYFSVTKAGDYWVIAKNNCGSDSDTITVSSTEIFIPNLITPNNDFKNDLFIIMGIPKGVGDLSIYNRWGQLIYSEKKYQNDWSGENISDGIYYYYYEYPSCNTYKGWIEILR
jgi:gliding motility-associated-like protein